MIIDRQAAVPSSASVVIAFTQKPKRWTPSEGDDRYRRTLYTRLWRSSLHPFLSTFDAPSGILRLYVNGQEVATTVHDGPMTPPDVDFVLGYHQADDVLTEGQIDDVRLWGRVLGPEEL